MVFNSDMIIEKLVEIGLTKNQARVYSELINKPEQSAGELSKKLTIDRSFVYNILKSLNNKGLVSYLTKGTKRLFSASDPENFLNDIDEKRTIASSIIEDLKNKVSSEEQEGSVWIYDGKVGLKILARELLKEKNFEILGGGGVLYTLEKLKYENSHFINLIREKGINGKIFVSKGNFSKLSKLLRLTRIKLKVIQKIPTQVNFVIFGNNTAIYDSDRLKTIIIKDKQVSNALRIYFDILWNKA